MKKVLLIIPLVLFSCKKETAITETNSVDSIKPTDNVAMQPTIDSASIKDSIVNNAPTTKEVLRTGVMRDVEGQRITRVADGEQLPFRIGEEFTEEGQEFVLKIENFNADKISVSLKPANASQNIRINQIKFPDGTMDGPFGKEITKAVNSKGDIEVVIGKSNMASGNTKGKFTVNIE